MTMKSWDFRSFDAVRLKIHEVGEGRPILLLHGLFSSAHMNWVKFGHAEKLASAGFHVVMPDFRVHGQSDAPHDPSSYPEDVLMHDVEALLAHYAWDEFDLGGFSLGARTAAKLLTNGLAPRRAILAGMGWEGLQAWDQRQQFFVDAINMRDKVERDDPHFMAVQFLKSQKIDPVAALLLLDSFGLINLDAVPEINVPVAVICGSEDQDNGSAPALAEKLPQGQYYEIPGTHMSSVTKEDMGNAMVEFLGKNI